MFDMRILAGSDKIPVFDITITDQWVEEGYYSKVLLALVYKDYFVIIIFQN